MNLLVRSIGSKCAEATIITVNIAYNLGRWRWWHGRTAAHDRKSVDQTAKQASMQTMADQNHRIMRHGDHDARK